MNDGFRGLAASIAFTLSCAAATAQAAQAPAAERFDIQAQALSGALRAYAEQTGEQVVFFSDIGQGLRSVAVVGEFTREQALSKLLENTGLTYERVNPRTIAIVEIGGVQTPEPRSGQTPPPAPTQRQDAAPDATSRTPRDRGGAGSRGDTGADDVAQLETVLVTGSNIRGAANRTAPITIYTKDDIERSGYTTTQQFIRSIPQNFGGDANGVSEDGQLGAGTARATNAEAATAINLRGLGAGSTLVLINGRRVAPSANAAAVDVSLIPLGAVERVEVLSDGASAIYGSEAVAGVVNFILRSDYEGAETSLSIGRGTEHGPWERIVSQMLGRSWESGNVLLSLQHQSRDALSASERSFTSQVPLPSDILPDREQSNLMLNLRQTLPAGLDLFGQLLYTRSDVRRYRAVPTGQYMSAHADMDNRNFNLGMGYQPGDNWRFELSGLHARQFTRHTGVATPTGYFGPLDFTREFELDSGEFKADGALWRLPAGAVRLALGGAYRRESYQVLPSNQSSSRDVRSAYAELSVPLIAPSQGLRYTHRLELSAAARYDDYSDFGETFNPRVGLAWSPIEELDFRASYSTAFRAPNASEMNLVNRVEGRWIMPYNRFSAPDGVGTVTALLISGSKPLQPEESRNWTYGMSYRPRLLEGLRLTLNVYDIEHTNRIQQPPFVLNVLQNPAVYGPLIRRYANDAEVQAEVDAFIAEGGVLDDIFGLGLAGIRYGYDYRLQNFARVTQQGFDVEVDYRFFKGEHDFQLKAYATYIDEIITSFGAGSASTDLVNTLTNPLHWRGRASAGWQYGAWSANLGMNYTNGYSDNTVTPSVPVDEWITFDLAVRLSLDGSWGATWLRDTSFGLSVANVFDRDPPAVVGSGLYPAGYDVANASPLGRIVSFSVRKIW